MRHPIVYSIILFQAARTFLVLLVVFTLLSQGAGDPITSKDDSKVAGLWYRTTREVINSAADSYIDSDWYRLMSSSPPKRRVARAPLADMINRKIIVKCGKDEVLYDDMCWE